jgi:hypothetical protein
MGSLNDFVVETWDAKTKVVKLSEIRPARGRWQNSGAILGRKAQPAVWQVRALADDPSVHCRLRSPRQPTAATRHPASRTCNSAGSH